MSPIPAESQFAKFNARQTFPLYGRVNHASQRMLHVHAHLNLQKDAQDVPLIFVHVNVHAGTVPS